MSTHPSHSDRPSPPQAPGSLARIADSLSHPHVTQTGLTTTPDGRWALMVRVRPGIAVPIDDIERASEGHPVVYREAPGSYPVARPASPALGEWPMDSGYGEPGGRGCGLPASRSGP